VNTSITAAIAAKFCNGVVNDDDDDFDYEGDDDDDDDDDDDTDYDKMILMI
jgi:hypothetical protein